MATLWLRMAQIYAHRWTAPHGESPDAAGGSAGTWAKGLAGFTGEQIAIGLKACLVRADPWPPSLPEFRAMCMAIPRMSAVRRELANPEGERSAFSMLVWSKLDGHAYRRAEGRAVDRMLQEAYDEACEHAMSGGELPEARAALAPPTKEPIKPADPSVAKAALDEARSILRGMPDLRKADDEGVDATT